MPPATIFLPPLRFQIYSILQWRNILTEFLDVERVVTVFQPFGSCCIEAYQAIQYRYAAAAFNPL